MIPVDLATTTLNSDADGTAQKMYSEISTQTRDGHMHWPTHPCEG